jgi:hypothetical protein
MINEKDYPFEDCDEPQYEYYYCDDDDDDDEERPWGKQFYHDIDYTDAL